MDLFEGLEEKEVTLFLKNKFRYKCIIKRVRGRFLEFYDLVDEMSRLVALDEISNVRVENGK